jgi:hypothetical protein
MFRVRSDLGDNFQAPGILDGDFDTEVAFPGQFCRIKYLSMETPGVSPPYYSS